MTGILWAVIQEPFPVKPLFSKGKPHHITLQYKVEREAWEEIIGQPMTALAVQHCWNNRIQAVKVILPSWVQCQNSNPHVTVSWIPDVKPVEANAMLMEEGTNKEVAHFIIPTIIEWFEFK